MRDSTSELSAAALEALLEVAATSPADFAAHYRTRTAWLQGFLGHVDSTGTISDMTAITCCAFPECPAPQCVRHM